MDLPVNQIICGDCLEVMKDLPDNCVDLVLTDPPYGIGKDYGNDSDKEFSSEWFEIAKRISKALIFTCGVVNMFKYPQPDWVLCWFKPGAISRTKYGFNSWEPILLYEAPHSTREPDVIRCPVGKQLDVGNHPTPKPLQLFFHLVRRFSIDNDLILDPFCGSGTTCVAAKMLGRNYVGIDISPEYCEIARKRLLAVDTGVPVKEQNKGQMALFGKGD